MRWLYCCIAVWCMRARVCRVRVYIYMYTYDTGLIRLRYTVTDTYRVVKSAGYTLNSSENEFKFMALQSWRVNSMNSYSTCRLRRHTVLRTAV